MHPRLLEFYESELQYLQEVGAEFARAHPKSAGRLGLTGSGTVDPYVERLLEGAAFLAARVKLKIEARVPDFTEQLLSLVLPNAVAPTPSCAIVEFKPDYDEPALREGVVIPRGTSLRTPLQKGEGAACEFRTAHDVTLWPISVEEVRHRSGTGSLAASGVRLGASVRGAVTIRLSTRGGGPFSALSLDELDVFITGPANIGARLYSLLAAHCVGGVVLQGNTDRRVAVEPIGFSDEQALFPATQAGFRGYRAIHEYLTMPERISFLRLEGMKAALASVDTDVVDLALLLDSTDASLDEALAPEHVRLGCSPAVNLFSKSTDRLTIDGRKVEYHLIPDRNRPLDFEVHSIVSASSQSDAGTERRPIVPFYFYRHADRTSEVASYYTVARRQRISPAPNDPRPARSSYVGTESFISLVDSEGDFISGGVRHLDVEALCTNRDLAILTSFGRGRTDFVSDGIPAAESVRCIVGPTRPRPAPAFGETAWHLVSLLAANHLGFSGNGKLQDAQSLRTILGIFADPNDRGTARRIDAIKELKAAPSIQSIDGAGPICYARGLSVALHVDEDAFEGDAIPLGVALDEFFARATTINSFTELVMYDSRNLKDPIKRWKPRSGSRLTL